MLSRFGQDVKERRRVLPEKFYAQPNNLRDWKYGNLNKSNLGNLYGNHKKVNRIRFFVKKTQWNFLYFYYFVYTLLPNIKMSIDEVKYAKKSFTCKVIVEMDMNGGDVPLLFRDLKFLIKCCLVSDSIFLKSQVHVQ